MTFFVPGDDRLHYALVTAPPRIEPGEWGWADATATAFFRERIVTRWLVGDEARAKLEKIARYLVGAHRVRVELRPWDADPARWHQTSEAVTWRQLNEETVSELARRSSAVPARLPAGW